MAVILVGERRQQSGERLLKYKVLFRPRLTRKRQQNVHQRLNLDTPLRLEDGADDRIDTVMRHRLSRSAQRGSCVEVGCTTRVSDGHTIWDATYPG